ncbi:hypothetical protein [Sulfitobacter pontiacus]|uniref:hypothetical protein n=1 Tax=Sulfitobacter pontiacus TaxID=60137 RepID=UPI0030EE8675
MIRAEFANLVVKYGDKGMLAEPKLLGAAFFADPLIRRLSKKSYHFIDVDMAMLDENEPESICIFGRFVKDIDLERDQILENGKLVSNHRLMPSAPSSLFFVFPARHRIIFAPETRFAPTLSEFRSTFYSFLKDAWRKEIRRQYDEINKIEKRSKTWSELKKEFPAPDVRLVHLTSPSSVDKFVQRFDIINKMTIAVIERNNEWDRSDSLADIKKALQPAKPDVAKIVATGGKKGLKKKGTAKVVKAATKAGYEEVTLQGKTPDGTTLIGSNDDFKLRFDLTEKVTSVKAAAKSAWTKMKDALSDGLVTTNFSENELSNNILASKTLLEDRKDA